MEAEHDEEDERPFRSPLSDEPDVDDPAETRRNVDEEDELYREPPTADDEDLSHEPPADNESWPDEHDDLAMYGGKRPSVVGEVMSKISLDTLRRRESMAPRLQRMSIADRRNTVQFAEESIAQYFGSRGGGIRQSVVDFGRMGGGPTVPQTTAQGLNERRKSLAPHLQSSWQPGHEQEDQLVPDVVLRKRRSNVFHRRDHSWVGSYDVGKDYWTRDERAETEEPLKVPFRMDEGYSPWYEMASAEALEADLTKLRHERSLLLKQQQEREHQQQRAMSDAHSILDMDMPHEKSSSPGFLRDVVELFQKLSAGKTLLQLDQIDGALMLCGIMDHFTFTHIQAGFCFVSAGGGKYRGLSTHEFRRYLEILAKILGISLFDLMKKLKNIDLDASDD